MSLSKKDALFLTFIYLVSFANMYISDLPGILKGQLIDQLEMSSQKANYFYSLLYSCYNLPVIFVVFFVGLSVDLFGSGIVACLITLFFTFGTFFYTGQCLFGVGISLKTPILMAIGRFFAGIGGSCFSVLQYSWILQRLHFKSAVMPLAMLNVFGRLGSLANVWLTPRISQIYGMAGAVNAATGLCFVAMMLCFMAYNLDE
jgi:MFS family permease